MAKYKDLLISAFADKKAFEKWMATNHAKADGLWVKFAKKSSGIRSVSYEEAREVAIMYGWIDGLKNAVDEAYYALRFTPRRSKSKWSQINREIAEQLLKSRKMKAPGIAQVEAAKQDGRWDAAYPSASKMEVPEDFTRALAKNEAAREFFAAIDRTNRYAILYRLHEARRPATRAARIAKLVAMLANNELIHPKKKV